MLIHKMRLDDNMAVLDVNSGAVHLVDDVIYDLLDYYDGSNGEEAVAALKERYSEEDLREALGEMQELQDNGLLFSPGFDVPPTFAEKPIVKSLCLLVTHDCNLRCGYCFADTGSFGGCRQLMSKETAEKAVEFAIEGSMKRHNLELDLFGGEPLMNWPVVVHIVEYVRRREKETGKNKMQRYSKLIGLFFCFLGFGVTVHHNSSTFNRLCVDRRNSLSTERTDRSGKSRCNQ